MDENRLNGIQIGIVSNLNDETGLGRVKVRFPKLEDKESDWLRLTSPMAGGKRGFFMRPEKDDEVLVIYEDGNTTGSAYVLGSVWSDTDAPPEHDGNHLENNWRFIRSRSGHIVKLDDTSGSEKIEVTHQNGKGQIQIDKTSVTIVMKYSGGNITLKASDDGKLSIDAKTIEIKASGTMLLEATGDMTIKGATVNIN